MRHHLRPCALASVLIVCCALLMAGCSGPGKGRPDEGRGPGGPGGPGPSFLPTVFDTKPFNPNVDRLPPMYTGHSPELIYSSIQMRRLRTEREEQETEEQYRARMSREIVLPLTGALDFDSIYAFRITPSDIRYNEKDRAMHVRCPLSPAFEAGSEKAAKKAFVARYLPQLDNRYTITKKDASRVTIEEIKFSEYAVVVVNPGGLPLKAKAAHPADDAGPQGVPGERAGEWLETAIKMGPGEIRRIEGGIMMLLIGKLAAPYASYEEVCRKPTAERPGTYLGRYHYLYINLMEIWFYDVVNGGVLKRMPPL